MTEQQYEKWERWFRARPKAYQGLRNLNRWIPGIVYFLYPLTALLLLWQKDERVIRFLSVPAVGFAVVTVIRSKINAPRPYEVLSIHPLIPRTKSGESFPSRHVASIFLIAMAMGFLHPWLGWLMGLLGVVMMVVRVVAGIHFPKDVLAGALFSILAGWIGFFWIP